MSSGEARRRLVARARQELPHPGDPRRLLDDLLDAGVSGPETLEVLARTSLAWNQLRDLGLERSWQNGFGWFLARNLMIFGALSLVFMLTVHVPLALLEAGLAGAAAYYVLVLSLAPLRLRRHKRRREGILQAYQADLGSYLDSLE